MHTNAMWRNVPTAATQPWLPKPDELQRNEIDCRVLGNEVDSITIPDKSMWANKVIFNQKFIINQ